jgi:mevalonate kinase
MTELSARASGKVILLGEHAVVYGVPGIAAGIERGARAHARVLEAGARSTLSLGGDTFVADPNGRDLDRAFAALASELSSPVEVAAEADLPPGGGLGCSAALAVAIARASYGACAGALLDERKPEARAHILERAAAWERVFHGNPSGIDTAAAAIGSCLRFERGVGPTPIAAPVDLWLAIGSSGKGASTKEMVEGLAHLKERKPDLVGKFLSGVESLVKNAELAILHADAAALGQLLDLNQMLLAGVLISTESIEDMCRLARQAGALGAKLTGSGGGGSVIALGGVARPNTEGSTAEKLAGAVVEAWERSGKTGFVTRIAAADRSAQARSTSPSAF